MAAPPALVLKPQVSGAVPLLGLRVTVCEPVSLWGGPLGGPGFPEALQLTWTEFLLIFDARCCGDPLSGMGGELPTTPQSGWGWNPSFLRKVLRRGVNTLDSEPLHMRVGPAHFTAPPLLPVSRWLPLHILSYRSSLQLGFTELSRVMVL